MSKRNRPNPKPMAAQAPSTISTIALGQPGLNTSGGMILEELHPRLRGAEAARIYEEMAQNDATIAAALYSIEGFLRKIKWRVKPADDSARAKAEAEFIESCRDDMDRSWSDFIADALSMLTYGFSLHEIVLKYRRGLAETNPRFRSKYDDGRIGWRNIDLRAQRSISEWDIDPKTGEILGCWQSAPNYGGKKTYLPMSRCVLFRTRTLKNNPEGRSLLRGGYRSWHFKKRIEETEAVGLVRSLQNLPKIQLPVSIMSPNASPAEKAIRAQFERMGSLLSKDQLSVVIMPSELDASGMPTGYKFETIGSVGNQANADVVIKRYDHRILMAMASEFLLLGSGSTGSFALANQKSDNFAQSLEFYADILGDAINEVCIRRLMEVNLVPVEFWPTLEHDPVALVDAAALALFMSQAKAFLSPTLGTENALRERINLPEINEDQFDPGGVQKQADIDTEAAELAAELAPEPVVQEPAEPTEE